MAATPQLELFRTALRSIPPITSSQSNQPSKASEPRFYQAVEHTAPSLDQRTTTPYNHPLELYKLCPTPPTLPALTATKTFLLHVYKPPLNFKMTKNLSKIFGNTYENASRPGRHVGLCVWCRQLSEEVDSDWCGDLKRCRVGSCRS